MNNPKDDRVPAVLIGAMSGGIEAFITHPLWVWKTRLQCGLPFTFNPTIIYRGVSSNVMTMSTIISVRYTVNEQIKKTFQLSDNQKMISAYFSGMITAPLMSFIELGMTQQQANSKDKKSMAVIKTHAQLIQNHSYRVSLTGVTMVAMRDGWFCLGFLALTPFIKAQIQKKHTNKNQIAISIVSGSTAGMLSAFFSQPCDTIKTRQHACANLMDKKSLGIIQAGRHIYTDRGLLGFYSGLLWRSARVVTGVTILAYTSEQLTRINKSS